MFSRVASAVLKLVLEPLSNGAPTKHCSVPENYDASTSSRKNTGALCEFRSSSTVMYRRGQLLANGAGWAGWAGLVVKFIFMKDT